MNMNLQNIYKIIEYNIFKIKHYLKYFEKYMENKGSLQNKKRAKLGTFENYHIRRNMF